MAETAKSESEWYKTGRRALPLQDHIDDLTCLVSA
jgi:hypothetical protein